MDEEDPCEDFCDCLGYGLCACCCGLTCAEMSYRLHWIEKQKRREARAAERLNREGPRWGQASNPADTAAPVPMTMVASRGAPPMEGLARITMTYSGGNQYEGTVNDVNKPHGLVADGNGGIFRYTNGDRYEGDFVDGLMDGEGKLFYASGDIFEGTFKDGKMHGHGSLSFAGHDFAVSGRWVDGIPPTKFCQFSSNGNVYNGGITRKMRHGTGVMRYKNGDLYDGDWRLNMRNGAGKMMYRSGNAYDGEWKDDMKNGEGVFIFAKGHFYQGSFVDDKRHGKGTMTNPEGEVSEGMWVNDKREPTAKVPIAKAPENEDKNEKKNEKKKKDATKVMPSKKRRSTFEISNPMLAEGGGTEVEFHL